MKARTTETLAHEIIDAAATDSWNAITVRPLSENGVGLGNELLFFFKPEVFSTPLEETRTKLISLVFDKFAKFSAESSGVFLFSGEYLGATNTIARHYGYINRLSESASNLVRDEDRLIMLESLDLDTNLEIPVLGGHEALNRFDALDPHSLDRLWASKRSHKLRGGFYYQLFTIQDETTILVNAFHPLQIAHYTAPGQCVCAVVLRSDTSWKSLRHEMVGDTFPQNALRTSIRGTLAARTRALRLEEVSVAFNYCHLSAGPFEALFELENFLGPEEVANFKVETSAVGRKLDEKESGQDLVRHALSNPVTEIGKRKTELFSLTEDMDTDQACRSYLENFVQVRAPVR